MTRQEERLTNLYLFTIAASKLVSLITDPESPQRIDELQREIREKLGMANDPFTEVRANK